MNKLLQFGDVLPCPRWKSHGIDPQTISPAARAPQSPSQDDLVSEPLRRWAAASEKSVAMGIMDMDAGRLEREWRLE